MSAEIIPFPNPDDNGAREALTSALDHWTFRDEIAFSSRAASDIVLLKLAEAGFVIVPINQAGIS